MDFKDIIKLNRERLGLTMEELGDKVGVSKATIQRWESGEIKNVRRDKISKLANALNTTPSTIMGWDEQTNDPKNKDEFSHVIFENAQQAFEFILSQPSVSAYGGYDLDKMSDDEIIEFAEDIQKMMKIIASKYTNK